MDFPEAWTRYEREIKRLSLSQYVPGLDADDVASEMSVCLWKATQTYRSGGTEFGTYWWSLWLNRRSDIAASYHAIKRIHGIPVEHVPEREYSNEMFPMPPTKDPLGRAVWGALAGGDTPKEVQDNETISRRRYYAILDGWRTPEVRERLGG